MLGAEATELPEREGVRERVAGWRHRASWGVQGAGIRDRADAAARLRALAQVADLARLRKGQGDEQQECERKRSTGTSVVDSCCAS